MADISKVRMLDGTEYNYKDAKARADITALNESLGDVQADLENVTDDLSGVSSDLQSLQNKFDALIDADEGRY